MHIRPRQGRLLIQIKETGCAWPEDLPSLRRENTAVADRRYDAASVPKIVLQAVGSEAIAGRPGDTRLCRPSRNSKFRAIIAITES